MAMTNSNYFFHHTAAGVTQPQDTGEPYNKLDHGTNKEAQLPRLAANGQYDALHV